MEIILVGSQNDTETLSLIIEEELQLKSSPIAFEDVLSVKYYRNSNQVFILAARELSFDLAVNVLAHIKTNNPSAYIMLLAEDKNFGLMAAALEYGVNNFWVLTVISDSVRNKIKDQLKSLVQTKKSKRILAIGAHPDDVEIGCGGTLLKHISKNDEVFILTLTRGAAGGDTEKRYLEAKAASEFLRANLKISNLKDTSVSDGPKTIRIIEEVIYDFQPDIIYTHSANDNHQDHRNTNLATIIAARKVDEVYAYQAPSTNINFHPQKFEPVDSFIDTKLQLIAFHETQKNKCVYLKDDIIRATAIYWGRYVNYKLVEPFEIIKS